MKIQLNKVRGVYIKKYNKSVARLVNRNKDRRLDFVRRMVTICTMAFRRLVISTH